MSGRSRSRSLAPALASVAACAWPSEPSAPVSSAVFPESTPIVFPGFIQPIAGAATRPLVGRSKQLLHLFDGGLADRLVEDDLAARHGDDAVAGLEDVVHVVAGEDARGGLGAKTPGEAG